MSLYRVFLCPSLPTGVFLLPLEKYSPTMTTELFCAHEEKPSLRYGIQAFVYLPSFPKGALEIQPGPPHFQSSGSLGFKQNYHASDTKHSSFCSRKRHTKEPYR